MGINIFKARSQKKEADEIISSAQYKAHQAEKRLDKARGKSSKLIDTILDQKKSYAETVIPTALAVLEKCQNINKLETNISLDTVNNFILYDAPELKNQSVTIAEVIGTGIKGSATGTALALGSMSAVSTFGAASTGTAISSLSGAAASNATLAWFGGGAISAGGAGIAGGAMVLGGIVLAPVAIFAMFKYSENAEKKLTEAYSYSSSVDIEIEKIDAAIEASEVINEHINIYSQTLGGISERLMVSAEKLNNALIQNKRKKEIVYLKMQTILLLKAMKGLLSIRILDDENNPSEESILVISHAKNLTTKNIDNQLISVISGKSSKDENRSIKYFLFGNADARTQKNRTKTNVAILTISLALYYYATKGHDIKISPYIYYISILLMIRSLISILGNALKFRYIAASNFMSLLVIIYAAYKIITGSH